MAKEITTSEILLLINERDKHTQEKLSDMAETQKEVSFSIKKICDHIIVTEEDRKHDTEFKKGVREHIKFATPILYKAQDHQAARAKVLLIVAGFFVAGILGAYFKFN